MTQICAGFCTGRPLNIRKPFQTRACRQQAPIQSRYRGQGTDRSRVAEFKHHEQDSGSPEVQIAQLTARVNQLTGHLQVHKKDYASRRGLLAVLSNRKSLMQYLIKKDRDAYERIIEDLNIRPLKVQAGRNVLIKLQRGAEPEKVHTMDAEMDAGA